jgi:hypothetical protein
MGNSSSSLTSTEQIKEKLKKEEEIFANNMAAFNNRQQATPGTTKNNNNKEQERHHIKLKRDADKVHTELRMLSKHHPPAQDNLTRLLDQIFDRQNIQNLKTLLDQNGAFAQLLPHIAILALDFDKEFPHGVQALPKQTGQSYKLTQMQCAVLLANGFFCMFGARKHGQSSYNDFNFNRY